jgi:hypothetical protein
VSETERRDWPWLVSLLAAGCLVLALFALNAGHYTRGAGGVPLDDAWIHFQFARNLARGDGLSFNPGEPTSGSTSPLWTLLLAGAYLARPAFPIAGQVVSAACFLATLGATYVVGRQLTGSRRAAWLAGAIVATNGRAVWAGLSALETCLFAALGTLAIGAYAADRKARRFRLRTGLLFGLAATSRPEGYLLFALALAGALLALITQRDLAWRVRLRRMPILPTALFAAIVLPYLLFSLHAGGHLLPNTYRAKAAAALLPDQDFLSLAARYLILDNALLLPFFLLGLLLVFRRAPLLVSWSVGLPLAFAFLHVPLYQHGRYLIPLIPCNAILGIAGLLEARRLARRRGWLRSSMRVAPAVLAALLVVAGTAWRLPEMARQYAWNVDEINTMHVTTGTWIARNTPPDALLALNDIGAIAYTSERRVLDLAGLVTPEVVPLLRSPERDALLIDLMRERGVEYAAIFPAWFPGMATRGDLWEEVHRVTLEHRTIAGGETMVVYRAR